MVDVVYALHTFEAENEDELTFEAGERIIVLERDDQYSDGWFQVRPTRSSLSYYRLPRSALAQSRFERHELHLDEVGVPSEIRDAAYRRIRGRSGRRSRDQNHHLGCVRTLIRRPTSAGSE